MDGSKLVQMPEVPRRPVRWIELFDLPASGPGLLDQGGDETMDRLRVLQVPEQLPAS